MNKLINNFIRIGVISIFVLAMALLPSQAAAQSVIDVDFETQPLFDVGNFLPGDSITKEVTVSNNSQAIQTVEIGTANVFDDHDLGEHLDIEIDIPNDADYNESLDDFLQAGNISLSTLPAGSDITYTLTVSFENIDDNSYQGKSLGFDICVGFAGGQMSCSNVADNPGGDNGDGEGDPEPEGDDVGRGGGGPNTFTSSSDDPKDEENGDVAGVATTTQPDLSGPLSRLEDALRGLLSTLNQPEPQVAGASTQADYPGLPNTGDNSNQGLALAALLLMLFAMLRLTRSLISRYRQADNS